MRSFNWLSTLAVLLLGLSAQGQTTFFSENFNNGCVSLCLADSYAGWSISSTGTNGAFANDWYISCAENGNAPGNCGSGCGNDASLHIGSAPGSPAGLCPSGDCGAAYDASLASVVTNRRVESPLIDCSGFLNVQIQFDYIAAQSNLGTDFYTVEYSSDGGATWNSLGNGPASACCCNFLDCFSVGCCAPSTTTCGSLRQGNWTQANLALPASAANNPNVRIGFNWTNNGDNIGTDPSVAIDDLQVSGDVNLPVGITAFSGLRVDAGVELAWELALEGGMERLSLLKSLDGMRFEAIAEFGMERNGVLEAKGQYLDGESAFDRVYYRLRLEDAQGQGHLSRILEVDAGEMDRIVFFPNPLDQGRPLGVALSTAYDSRVVWELYGLDGQRIWSEELEVKRGSRHLEMVVPELAPGIYIVHSKINENQSFQKLIIK